MDEVQAAICRRYYLPGPLNSLCLSTPNSPRRQLAGWELGDDATIVYFQYKKDLRQACQVYPSSAPPKQKEPGFMKHRLAFVNPMNTCQCSIVPGDTDNLALLISKGILNLH